MSTTKHIAEKSIQERLLSQEWRDSEWFPVSIGICAAFLSRRASSRSASILKSEGIKSDFQ